MSVLKISTAVENMIRDPFKNMHLTTALVTTCVGMIAGTYVAESTLKEDLDTRPQEPSSAYVEIFNQKADDIRKMRLKASILSKEKDVADYRAGQSNEFGQTAGMDKKISNLVGNIQNQTVNLWAEAVTSKSLKEQDMQMVFNNHSDLFGGIARPSSFNAYAIEECQNEIRQERPWAKNNLTIEANEVMRCTQDKTKFDATAVFGFVPGMAVALASVSLLGSGAGRIRRRAQIKDIEKRNAAARRKSQMKTP